MLFICATPIGNLQDITLRVLECLKNVDYLAVESTARTRKLLHYYDIRAPLLSYREGGREKKEQQLLGLLQGGAKIALLSDAGMPAISDPGHSLVRRLRELELPFTVLPGPSAALTALLLSGYPTRRFVFWGFLSRRQKERRRELLAVAGEEKTGIIYEAPHRLIATLEDMAELLPEREIAICRELTKQFEEVLHGTPPALKEHFWQVKPRGEVTIVVSPLTGEEKEAAGKGPAAAAEQETREQLLAKEVQERLHKALKQGLPPAQAVKSVAKELALERRYVYRLLLELQEAKNLELPPA